MKKICGENPDSEAITSIEALCDHVHSLVARIEAVMAKRREKSSALLSPGINETDHES